MEIICEHVITGEGVKLLSKVKTLPRQISTNDMIRDQLICKMLFWIK